MGNYGNVDGLENAAMDAHIEDSLQINKPRFILFNTFISNDMADEYQRGIADIATPLVSSPCSSNGFLSEEALKFLMKSRKP